MSGNVFRMVGILGLVAASACKKTTTDDQNVQSAVGDDTSTAISSGAAKDADHAMIRVVNAVPGQATIDLKAGDARSFPGVTFKKITEYQTVTETRPKLTVVPAGQTTGAALVENSETVFDGRYYTVLVLPTDDGKTEIKTLRDDLTPSDTTKARIRVINAAPRVKEVDIKVAAQTDPLFDDVGFKDEAGFKNVDPGKVTLTVVSDENKQVLLQIPDIDLTAGSSVTIILVQTAATGNKIDFIKVVDQLGAKMGPTHR